MDEKKKTNHSRREFLRTVGAAAFTLGAAASCGKEIGGSDISKEKPFQPDRNDKLDYDDFVYTTCSICMIRCGMKVYRKDGLAIFIEGNPADPFNQGKLCPKGKAALGFLYNPDRLLYPLIRTNPAEKDFGVDPQWQQITWEEAYTTIIAQIKAATNDYADGCPFAIFSHGAYGWCKQLLRAIGSPNLVTHYDTCFNTSFVARKALLGGNPWTNLRGAKYILSFGWDQLERCKNTPTIQVTAAIEDGAKVICFNPYQGALGSKADKWIPIKPGTDLAVMLAMINYILENDLYDAAALARTNFTDHEAEIRANFSAYDADWAEGKSGVPASTINRIAEEFTDPVNQPAVIPMHKRDGAAGPNYKNSFHAAHAVLILNALVGAIDRQGGDACLAWGWSPKAPLSYEESLPITFNQLIQDNNSIDGKDDFPLVRDLIEDRGIFANTAQRILDQNPFELKMAMFRRYGLLSFPNPNKVADALKTLDYVVFMDSMPKQIMWFADMVLPENTFLESKWISFRKFCTPLYKLVFAGNRAQTPLGESKGWGGVLMELGKRIDIDRDTEYFKLTAGPEIFQTGDYVTGTDEKNSMANQIEAGMTFSDLLNVPNGVWVKEVPYNAKSSFGTPSGKIEIYGNKFNDATPPGPGYAPLPSWLPKSSYPDAEYPFYLLLIRWAGLKHSAPLTSDNPYSLDAFPGPIAMIHPDSAGDLEDGDMVWIESSNGKMKAQARISERLRPDCVVTNHNYGHAVNELTYPSPDQGDGALIVDRPEQDLIDIGDWSGNARMVDVCVKVYKVE